MRLGLVSDTHGELENVREAARRLKNEWRVDVVAHLGDECEDVAALREYWDGEIVQVPGVYCEHYRDPSVPNRITKEMAGYRILFTHTRGAHSNDLPGDPKPEDLAARREVDIVAFGHTHVPEIRCKGGVLWINPGHLKDRDQKGHGPSFAVLDLNPEEVRVRLVDLKSGVVFEEWRGPHPLPPRRGPHQGTGQKDPGR
ncbi:MAG: metallophosphoesterase family protein [Desulfotomaculales bacterium]